MNQNDENISYFPVLRDTNHHTWTHVDARRMTQFVCQQRRVFQREINIIYTFSFSINQTNSTINNLFIHICKSFLSEQQQLPPILLK